MAVSLILCSLHCASKNNANQSATEVWYVTYDWSMMAGFLPWVAVVMVTGILAWILSKLIPFFLRLHEINKALKHFPHLLPNHWFWGNLPQGQMISKALMLLLTLWVTTCTVPTSQQIMSENLSQIQNAEQYLQCCCDMMRNFGEEKTFALFLGFFNPILFVCHADTVREVLRQTHRKPNLFGMGYDALKPWIGDGLLVSYGKKWERNRKLLTPGFHFDILRPYIKLYQEAAMKCAKKLELHAVNHPEESMEISEPLGLCTLDVMLTCALSFKGNIQEQSHGHPYERAVTRLIQLIIWRAMHPHLIIDFIWRLSPSGREFRQLCDYTHKVSGDIIRARQETLARNPDALYEKRHLDFLDILLTAKDEDGVGLTAEEIRDEVDTFLFEGHDTTQAAVSWVVYCLAKYPEEQMKVWQEVSRVFGTKENLDWDDIQLLQYTSMFIKEVMRFHSPVPVMSRQTFQPITLNGVTLPAGLEIDIHIYALHHNPLIWDNPEVCSKSSSFSKFFSPHPLPPTDSSKEFDPQRFSAENFTSHDPYSFIPFSAGPRNCIGQTFALNEIKTVILCLVKQFKFGFDADHDKTIILQPLATLKSKTGIKVKIALRE